MSLIGDIRETRLRYACILIVLYVYLDCVMRIAHKLASRMLPNPLLLKSGLQILTSRVTLSSKDEATEEEVSPASIKDVGVIFTPGSRVQETLDSVKFQKIQVLVFLL